MPFRDPVTSLPADAITGKINPTTQLDAGQLAPGVTYATSPTVGDGTAQGYGVIIDSSGIRAYKATDVTPVFMLDSNTGNTTVQEGGSLTVQGGGSVNVLGTLYVTPSTQDRPGLTAGAAANGGDQLRWVPQRHATVLGTGPYGGPKHSHIIRAYQTVDTTFAAGASPDNKNVLLMQAQDANSGAGNPATVTMTTGSTNSPASSVDVSATTVTANGQDVFQYDIFTGTPVAQAGIAGAFAINSVSVPTYPFPTVQSVRMGVFIAAQTAATDTFDFFLRQGATNNARARFQGAGLSGPSVHQDFLVPANTAGVTYSNVAQRAGGGGTMTSTGDATLNYLQVTVRRAGA